MKIRKNISSPATKKQKKVWARPKYKEMRLGFEVTMYVSSR